MGAVPILGRSIDVAAGISEAGAILSGAAFDLASSFATGHGNDTLLSLENALGSRWPDIFRGSELANVFLGGEGGDIIEGTAGDDLLDGEGGFDTLDGGAGTDTCVNGESELDCEGANPGPEAQTIRDRHARFRALMAKWNATETAMLGAPSFDYLPRPLLVD